MNSDPRESTMRPGDAGEDPESVYRRGRVLSSQGLSAKARVLIQRAFTACPQRADMAYDLGVTARQGGDLPGAVAAWQAAVRLNPQMVDAHFNLARGLGELGRAEAARTAYRRLLALAPGHRDARYNLGNLLTAAEDFPAAAECFETVLSVNPDDVAAWVNLGLVMKQTACFERAERCYRKALALDPGHVEAHWNLSHLLMLQERWPEGWHHYEWRLRRAEAPAVTTAMPRWDGSAAPGRRLVLWAEQGAGDAIQFLRYARPAAERVGSVTVACHRSLVRLAVSAPGVGRAVPFDAAGGGDCHAPLMSLPLILGLPDPAAAWQGPYLTAGGALPVRRPGQPLRAGLVWAGNPAHGNDRNRSMALHRLFPLTALPCIRWFSFQVGAAGTLGSGMVDLAPALGDFADTARHLTAMDLVITVDTAVAHLAGAMGRPVWLLLPFIPDWRWPLSGSRTPWYPSMRLFRQPRPNGWEAVVARVAEELAAVS